MSNALRYTVLWGILGAAAFAWVPGCSSDNSPSGSSGTSGGTGSSTGSSGQTGSTGSGSTGSTGTGTGTSSGATGSTGSTGSGADAATNYTYTLIDDMETTTHGPIEYTGVTPPETPAYWFNFGGTAMGDVMTPPYQSFAFSAVDPATTTYMGKASAHAAHQVCALNGQYDVCGIGVEFAQMNDEDAGADAGCIVEPLDAAVSSPSSSDASASDAAAAADATTHDAAVSDASATVSDAASSTDGGASADAGLPVCKVTVPFDISQYKGVAFWAKAGDLGDAGSVALKVIFPDPDTDPRGGICNSTAAGAGGPTDLSQCYDSYAETVAVSGQWTQYQVLFKDLSLGTFGWVTPNAFNEQQVYGIDFQLQDNDPAGSPTENFDFWIDDLYFIK